MGILVSAVVLTLTVLPTLQDMTSITFWTRELTQKRRINVFLAWWHYYGSLKFNGTHGSVSWNTVLCGFGWHKT